MEEVTAKKLQKIKDRAVDIMHRSQDEAIATKLLEGMGLEDVTVFFGEDGAKKLTATYKIYPIDLLLV